MSFLSEPRDFFIKLLKRFFLLSATSASLITAALAASVVYIFVMSSVFPSVSFEYDSEVNFIHAGKLPLINLNVGATKIKQGDIVRVIYPDGRVYDFETTAQCSATVACPLKNPKLKSSQTAQADVSSHAISTKEKELKDTCRGDVLTTFNTGYWRSTVEELPPAADGSQVFVHHEFWQDTGPQTVRVSGSRDSCR